jgi:fatty acid amide hydrolase
VTSAASDGSTWCALSATELARRIAAREISSVDVVRAHITRCKDVEPVLNALAVPLYESALRAAQEADEAAKKGNSLGPLHGVPITVKECFDLAGTDSTMGVKSFVGQPVAQDGPLVARLRAAGAIVIGKTNIPQLLLMHECENPIFGKTRNPFDVDRSPGGSTGGGAALTAVGGAPLALGDDLGGSIRMPAHSVGIAGIKPTSDMLSQRGVRSNGRGLGLLQPVPGLLARKVADLRLGLGVLAPPELSREPDETSSLNLSSRELSDIRVGRVLDDGYLATFSQCDLAVEIAAAGLRAANITVVDFRPPDAGEGVGLFFEIMAARGGGELQNMLGSSPVDWRINRLLKLGRMPRWLRNVIASISELRGAKCQAQLLRSAGLANAEQLASLPARLQVWRDAFQRAMQQTKIDALLLPPYATVALKHGLSAQLPMAAAACYVFNLLDYPAGVVPVTYVSNHARPRITLSDVCEKMLRQNESDAEGLPIGVQLATRRFEEGLLLQLMQVVEDHVQFDARACTAPSSQIGKLRKHLVAETQ